MPAIKGKPSWNKGIPHSLEHKRKIGDANRGKKYGAFAYSNRLSWKGEDVGYLGLHAWVRRCLGKAQFCEHADSTCKGRFEWANKNHEYKRELDDWLQLCVSHHRRYDKVIPSWARHTQ
jgi:NUMOD3 motif